MNSKEIPPNLDDTVTPRITQLSQLIEISKLVAAGFFDLEHLLQQLLDTATDVLEAELGGLLVFAEEGQGFKCFKAKDAPRPLQRFPGDTDIAGLLDLNQESLRLADIRSHPQAVIFLSCYPELGPTLSVPLAHNNHPLGVLFVGNRAGSRTFTPADEELLQAFAAQATIAIDHDRLYDKVDELARLQERQRIAQALHDTLAQMLFIIGLEADGCLTQPDLAEPVRRRLRTIQRLSSRSGDELRSAIFALRSDHLPGRAGLVELLREQVAEFEAQSGISASLILPARLPTLPPLVSEATYRIVRESLKNVQKHARASAVMISLSGDQDSVTVTIQDNGIGLADSLPAEADDSDLRFGVTTMRQLTEQAHGHFIVTNNDDQGVIVKARFPAAGAWPL